MISDPGLKCALCSSGQTAKRKKTAARKNKRKKRTRQLRPLARMVFTAILGSFSNPQTPPPTPPPTRQRGPKATNTALCRGARSHKHIKKEGKRKIDRDPDDRISHAPLGRLLCIFAVYPIGGKRALFEWCTYRSLSVARPRS